MDTVAVMPGVVTYGHHTMQLVGAVRCLKATLCVPPPGWLPAAGCCLLLLLLLLLGLLTVGRGSDFSQLGLTRPSNEPAC
jgi:hypothetical protein